MKKQIHLKEECTYLISNHAVALNPMFDSEHLQLFFKGKMNHYLLPICDIMAYCLHGHEFQILVKLKSRKDFENYYKEKKKGKVQEDVPESTYIFSQAMANLQVSFVKHFNFINHRSGTLVARRFSRLLINSNEEKDSWIYRLNAGRVKHRYNKDWSNKKTGNSPLTSKLYYKYDLSFDEFQKGGLINGLKINLVANFVKTLTEPKSPYIEPKISEIHSTKNHINPKIE